MGVGSVELRDEHLEQVSRDPYKGTMKGPPYERVTLARGRIDVTGRWSVPGVPVPPGAEAVQVMQVTFFEQGDLDSTLEQGVWNLAPGSVSAPRSYDTPRPDCRLR